MKIAVLGYSGAGKSTLARALGERYGIPVLHFDTIQFTPNWEVRDRDEAHRMVHAFMENPAWVMDGNYTKFEYERRLDEADEILLLLFPRLASFVRAWRRYFRFRGKSRPDMAEGCPEKMDPEFMWWILWKGRTRKKRGEFRQIAEQYPEKTVVLKSQRDIDRYLEGLPC
ncbi:MAG: DNA topology modulation protein FlaR [Oscillospiraceae bacterium]|jgi:adenylate kinase family enzyme|nr:DNA topology modulation protein FlaR [Oscillospiraceae bacterium]